MTPDHHWCITCDHPATECTCGDTDGWRWDDFWQPFMPWEGDDEQ